MSLGKDMLVLKDQFLVLLQDIFTIKDVSGMAKLVQGEEALLLNVYINKRLTPTEISEALEVTKGRVTVILNGLKKKNFINFDIDSKDRRKLHVSLTETGRVYLEEKLDRDNSYFSLMFETIAQDDSRLLVELLNRIFNKMKEVKFNEKDG